MSDAHPVKTCLIDEDPPSKNRVMGLDAFSYSRTRSTRSETLETHQEIRTTDTTTVSGILYWLNRDPIQERAQINLYSFGPNSPVNGFDVLGRAWGNARAVRHFYTGGGRNVTLDEIGHRSTVTAAATPQMDAYEQIARDAALNSAGNLSCNGSSGVVSDHIQHSDSVGVNSGVFWIGGFSLARQYDCSIELNCSTCAGTYTCTLWFFMNDEFVDPLDFDNSGDDPWDDWQLGGTPFSVLGDWERNIDGTF